MKKLNREVVAKHASRFFLLFMSFMLILSLCSMASPQGEFAITIENPDNIPQDYSLMYVNPDDVSTTLNLDFGTNTVYGDVRELTFHNTTAEYAVILFYGVDSNSNSAIVCNGDFYSDVSISTGVRYDVYVTDNPVLTVVESDGNSESRFLVVVPISSPTDSLTSVWTSITNWIISSLNTVQGAFIEGGITYIEETVPALNITYNDNTYTIVDANELFSYRYMWYDGNRIDSLSLLTQSNIVVQGNIPVLAYSYEGTVIAFSDGNGTWAIDNGLLGVSNTPNPNSLTLLGTLAVIGVSISLSFLLIGVISRFLKLRG